MKSILLPVITAFLFLSIVTGYAQDDSAGDNSDLSGDSVVEQDVIESGTVITGDTTEEDSVKEDSAESSASDDALAERRQDKKNNIIKKNAVKETDGKTQVEDNKTEVLAESFSGDLMQISEGNFKYRRIPDIKLVDIQVTMATEQVAEVSLDADEEQAGSGGIFGMSKTASDVVVKGGIILFIFAVFILYKSRARTGGGRQSGRKVLNSYRK